MLDSGYEGLDYDTLNDTISEHKVKTKVVLYELQLPLYNDSESFHFCLEFSFCQAIPHRKVYYSENQIEQRHEISNNMVCATSKGSDQPAHMRSLIRVFANCLNIL